MTGELGRIAGEAHMFTQGHSNSPREWAEDGMWPTGRREKADGMSEHAMSGVDHSPALTR